MTVSRETYVPKILASPRSIRKAGRETLAQTYPYNCAYSLP